MTCDCKNFDERLSVSYMQSCKYITNGAFIIDVGCAMGRSVLELGDHLEKEHDIKTKITGIDVRTIQDMIECFPHGVDHLGGTEKFTADIKNVRKRLDRFILSPVNMVKDMDGTADFILCFGFSCEPEVRKESFLRMVQFLKPDGKAIFDVMTPRSLDFLRRKLYILPFLAYSSGKLYRKLMTKEEAIQHAELCISNDFKNDGKNCTHGTIIHIHRD